MADVFPVIPEELPAQVAESIGRSPAFVFHEDGRSGRFQLIDGALVERQGVKAVKQWLELMLRQKPGAIPIYRTSGTTQPGVEAVSLDRRVPEGWIFAEIERNVRERPPRSARPSGHLTVLSLRACGAAWRSASRSGCTPERVRR